MIKQVTQSDPIGMMQAAVIHSESWKASHRNICSAEFLAIHAPERQREYLETEMEKGAQLFVLISEKPVGIVTVCGDLIENLYILTSEQNKGYGTQLLAFAMKKCAGVPTLWVLNTNDRARRFYERHGFQSTGNVVRHGDCLYEEEFRLRQKGRFA